MFQGKDFLFDIEKKEPPPFSKIWLRLPDYFPGKGKRHLEIKVPLPFSKIWLKLPDYFLGKGGWLRGWLLFRGLPPFSAWLLFRHSTFSPKEHRPQ